MLFDLGYLVSMIRASMVEVMQRPYIRTAVLKGMRFRQVIIGHALRNAMINPVFRLLAGGLAGAAAQISAPAVVAGEAEAYAAAGPSV